MGRVDGTLRDWATERLIDSARDAGADLSSDAVQTWIADESNALAAHLEGTASHYMSQTADPIPGVA